MIERRLPINITYVRELLDENKVMRELAAEAVEALWEAGKNGTARRIDSALGEGK